MITDQLSDHLVIKTFGGLEEVLAQECENAGLGPARNLLRAVAIPHRPDSVYRANMTLRTALRVLVPLTEFKIETYEDIYEGAKAYQWSRFIHPEHTFVIRPSIQTRHFPRKGLLALKVKDAICDEIRAERGFRPSVDKISPDWIIDLHVGEKLVHLSLDTSGVPLFKRGWRKKLGPASLNEVLAAGLLYLSGWNPDTEDFFDLMCGSGTVLAEAADMATRRAPGLHGRGYAFQIFPGFDPRLHQKVKRELAARQQKMAIKIWGSDKDPASIQVAQHNLTAAGHKGRVTLKVADFRNLPLTPQGFIFLNPPYGRRLSSPDLKALYTDIGSFLKHQCAGSRAGIFIGNPKGLELIGLRASKKFSLLNGPIPCVFALYELFKGPRRKHLNLQNEKRSL